MSVGAETSGTRTLLVGPIGPRPWLAMSEVADAARALGHDVVVNGEPDFVLPMLEPLPPRMGRIVNSLPYLLAWYARMLFRWRRRARKSLERAAIEQIVVWDPLLALLCRTARSRGVTITWVLTPAEGPRSFQRLLRAAVALSADRVITSFVAESRLVVGRDTVVPVAVPRTPAAADVAGWVVFGSPRAPSARSLELLRARAAGDPALALVFNVRERDDVSPATLAALREAAAPQAIWWVPDSVWTDRLDGQPAIAIDPSDGLEIDHRHLCVLSTGGTLLASAENAGGFWNQIVTAKPDATGWKRVQLRADASLLGDEREWVARALPRAVMTRDDAIADQGISVEHCPVCGATARNAVLTVAGVEVERCATCGLTYAGKVLPPELVHTEDYHSGTGTCGADYTSRAMQPFVEAIADTRLDALASLGVQPGRLLDIGAGLGHLVARANARGWRAEGLEVVPAAAEAARRLYGVTVHVGDLADLDPEPFDVVVLGQTLEHIANPVDTLETIREKHLAPDGHVLVEVPNVRSVARVLQGKRWMHWQPGDHHFYPEAKTMIDIFDRAGYDVALLRSDSIATPGLPESVLAFNLGLLSRGVVSSWPQIRQVMQRVRAERPLRALSALVDRAGLGQNLLVVGKPR